MTNDRKCGDCTHFVCFNFCNALAEQVEATTTACGDFEAFNAVVAEPPIKDKIVVRSDGDEWVFEPDNVNSNAIVTYTPRGGDPVVVSIANHHYVSLCVLFLLDGSRTLSFYDERLP